MFHDHKDMRLEINYREKKAARNTHTQSLNIMLLNNQWITEECKEEIKKYLEKSEIRKTMVQNL